MTRRRDPIEGSIGSYKMPVGEPTFGNYGHLPHQPMMTKALRKMDKLKLRQEMARVIDSKKVPKAKRSK